MENKEYLRVIPGDWTIKAINDLIAWEEKGISEFIKSEPDSNKQNNNAAFRIASTFPKPLTIVKQGDPKPPGTIDKPVWSGKMVALGTITDVVAYRQK